MIEKTKPEKLGSKAMKVKDIKRKETMLNNRLLSLPKLEKVSKEDFEDFKEEEEKLLEKAKSFVNELIELTKKVELEKEYDFLKRKIDIWQVKMVNVFDYCGDFEIPHRTDLKKLHEVPKCFKELFPEDTPEEEIEDARKFAQQIFEETGIKTEKGSIIMGLDLNTKAAIVYKTAKEFFSE